ncbi:response regulator [Stenotrophomonas aracearum]|jgi:two-component system cell cycle sensor histidine kinase/response regulator CckA|uniref:Response regulator n=1 Tax=Stenotrophomonas aracearum TaxID=3003272 RepID=A0ABY9Y9Z8_9GAMM|nr:response regulator [Stenotrophomonas sp. A5588]WNH47512.1 response regulator [Stenotrophomonas sp. A5588]
MAITLLLVDDEEDLRAVMTEGLSLYGFDVTTASDGSEALVQLRGDTQFAVVVTDVSMPGDVSGLQVAAEATALQPEALVMVVSGLQRSQLPPMPPSVEYVSKPYRLKNLVDLIRKQLT